MITTPEFTTETGAVEDRGGCNACRTSANPYTRPPGLTSGEVIRVTIQMTSQGGYEFRLCREHAAVHADDLQRVVDEVRAFGAR